MYIGANVGADQAPKMGNANPNKFKEPNNQIIIIIIIDHHHRSSSSMIYGARKSWSGFSGIPVKTVQSAHINSLHLICLFAIAQQNILKRKPLMKCLFRVCPLLFGYLGYPSSPRSPILNAVPNFTTGRTISALLL